MWNEAIEKKRQEMLVIAEKYGFHSAKTIKCSQELDKLINVVQFMNVKKRMSS